MCSVEDTLLEKGRDIRDGRDEGRRRSIDRSICSRGFFSRFNGIEAERLDEGFLFVY